MYRLMHYTMYVWLEFSRPFTMQHHGCKYVVEMLWIIVFSFMEFEFYPQCE
jgi:hypothetical protein